MSQKRLDYGKILKDLRKQLDELIREEQVLREAMKDIEFKLKSGYLTKCQQERLKCKPAPEVDRFCRDCSPEGYYMPTNINPFSPNACCLHPLTGEVIKNSCRNIERMSGSRNSYHNERCREEQNKILIGQRLRNNYLKYSV